MSAILLDSAYFTRKVIDRVDFAYGGPVNTSLVCTGPQVLTVGSMELFQLDAWLDGRPWALASAQLLLTDPNGASTVVNATVSGHSVTAAWTAAAPVGTWVRSWKATDSGSVVQYSIPVTFRVINSPGTPF